MQVNENDMSYQTDVEIQFLSYKAFDFRAYVTYEEDSEPVALELSDNGRGADLIAEDGIYSAYFTKYNVETGRYTLECEVQENET